MDNEHSSAVPDPNHMKDLEYLKETAEEFDPFDYDPDIEAVYCYAQHLYSGGFGIKQDKDQATELFGKLFVHLNQNGFYYDSCDATPWEEDGRCNRLAQKYKDIFLATEFFTEEGMGPNEYLIEIARIIQNGVKGVLDAGPRRAFSLVLNMPRPYGLSGGFGLVEMIRILDLRKLFLGECYMNGAGVDQNLQEALDYFLSCHTDHLAQKHLECPMCGQFEALHAKLDEAVKNDSGSERAIYNYISLARMTMEGLGCIASPKLANDYLDRAEELADKYDVLIGCDLDIIDYDLLGRFIKYDAKPYTEGMKLNVGDHIVLGKYDNRSVFWKVIDVKNGRALVLSDEALEASYILSCKSFNDDWATYSVNKMIEMEYKSDEYTGSAFLLTDAMVEEFLPDYKDRECFYRSQALKNCSQSRDWGSDTTADWWLLSMDDIESEKRHFVSSSGEIRAGDYRASRGIRPAMYVRTAM